MNRLIKVILLVLICLSGRQLSAATLYVTNNGDNGPGTLRNALLSAASGDLILFDATLTGSTIILTTGELTPSGDITIDGEDKNITISGNNSSRCFYSNVFNLNISNLTLTNGNASQGGAIYIEGGGGLNMYNVDILNCTASNDAGAIRAFGGTHTFTNVSFIGNSCTFWGGAYYSLFATTTMENVLFSGNSADKGGAAFFRGSTTLTGCTFSGNNANTTGGALYIYVNTNVNIENCIFWNNQYASTIGDLNAFYSIDNGSVVDLQIARSDIQGSGGSATWNGSFGSNNGGNLDVDPLFVSQISPSSAPTDLGNYRLDFNSPVMNLGGNLFSSTSTDLDEKTRIQYMIIDMGAYEFCNSIDTLNQFVCTSYTVPSGDETYTSSGVYYDTIPNAFGCDSVLVIYLTTQSTYNVITSTVCDSMVSPSGSYVWTASGVYQDTIPNSVSCDSIITFNLTVLNSTTNSISPVVCDSYTVPSGDETYNISGVYSDTLTNAMGCDSIITINLTVDYETTSSISPVVCESYTVPSGDETYSSSGVYTDTIPNSAGCDSVITINLIVNYNSTNSVSPVVCESYTVPSGDETYTSSGLYTDTIPTVSGCDSVIFIDLTVNYNSTSTINPSACNSYTVPSGDEFYTVSGTYIDTIPNMSGCDSVITINLTVNNESSATLNESACNSYTSPSGDYTWNTSGTYQDTISNAIGCDSVITINLTINNTTYNSFSDVACNQYVSPSGNYTWVSSGVYYDTIPNAAGCDSVITISLTINSLSYAVLNPVDCYSYTSPSGSNIWTSSGTYQDTILNTAGCDSIITINLTIASSSSSIADSACYSYTSPGGNTYTSSGIYQDTIPNFLGCDSIIILDLTIFNIDNSVYLTDEAQTLNASESGASYLWLDCGNNFAPMSDATEQSYEPAESGSYAVEITQNGCVDTSNCFDIEIVLTASTAFTPNGDGVNETLALHLEDPENLVIIFNRWGDEVARFTNYDDQFNAWDGSDQNGDVISGTYYYVIETSSRKYSGWIQVLR